MKQRPILFSTPMVQAILAGRKTQTRRVVKFKDHQPTTELNFPHFQFQAGNRHWQAGCLYGKKGDVLWVRETWGKGKASCKAYYKADAGDFQMLVDRWKPSIHMPKDAARIWLRITNVRVERLQDISEEDAINEGIEELKSNGIPHYRNYGKQLVAKEFNFFCSPVNSFRSLWESINGENSWNNNPLVWVIEFEGIEKPNNC